MPPRYQARPTDLLTRVRNEMDALGRPGMAGTSRLGGNRGRGGGQQSVVADGTQENDETSESAQLLVLSVTGDSIAAGSDTVAFDTVLDRQGGFLDVVPASGGAWVHPVTATYVLTYEHAWDSFEGGGDVDLELDGITALARRIGTRTDWQRGRGTIHYYAQAGQVGRIKVAHDGGSAQTCSATMWVSVSDPLEASPVDDTATNTAELYVDDVLVSSTTETLTANHAGAATVLIGEGAFTAVAGVYHYDDVALTHDGSNLLGNAGFESALAGTGTSRVVTSGNWRVYDPGASTVSIVASPTHTGSGALHGNITSGNGNGCYAFQDATLPEGDAFELELWVYPTSGVQDAQVLFDWSNRGGTAGSAVQSLSIAWSASAVTATVLGVALPASDPLPVGEWSKVRLVVAAQEVA